MAPAPMQKRMKIASKRFPVYVEKDAMVLNAVEHAKTDYRYVVESKTA